MASVTPDVPTVVVQFDQQLRVRSWSRGVELLTGVLAATAIGGSILERCRTDAGRRTVADLCSRALDGEIFAGEFEAGPFSGVPVYLEVEALRSESGAIEGGMVVARPAEVPVGLSRHGFAGYLVGELNLTVTTAFTYEQNLMRLERWLTKPTDEMDSNDARRFLRESDYHPATKNATLVALKAYMRFGLLEGFIPTDQATAIVALRGPKQLRNPKPALSIDDVRALLAVCKTPNTARVVHLGLYAGLRVTESASIGEVEWASNRGALVVFGKGRKVREVPIHPALESKKDFILSNDTTRGTLMAMCRSLSHYIGTPFSSHALRRTFGVQLSESGVNRDVIGALLGHSPSVTTAHYVPVRLTEMVEAVMKLPY